MKDSLKNVNKLFRIQTYLQQNPNKISQISTIKKIGLALFFNGVLLLVTAIERLLSIEQEVRDDTVAKQIKEMKRGGIERDERLRETRD